MARPDYEVFTVVPLEGGVRWTRLGSAYVSRDRKAINVQLDAAPTNGKLTLVPPKPPQGARTKPQA